MLIVKQIKNKIKIICIVLFAPLIKAQSIVNTENMSSMLDSTFVLTTSFEGNYTTGNIELMQFNSANQLAFKKDKNLVRLFFNYEFISQDKETISSDYTSQLRYSYSLNNNSLYSFIQAQKAVSLFLNSRYLVGIGYRYTIVKKEKNYLDIAFGPFYENEMYLKNSIVELHIINYRYSFSTFFNFKISDRLENNTVFYYQINSDYFNDYRVYLEPRISYSFEHFKIYSTFKYRFHSTPYIEIKNTDSQILFGFSYNLGFN
jgi:hypothetical protein